MTAPIVASVILQQTEPRFFNYNEGRKRIVAKKNKGKTSHPERNKQQTSPLFRKSRNFHFMHSITRIKTIDLENRGSNVSRCATNVFHALLTICYMHRCHPALIYTVQCENKTQQRQINTIKLAQLEVIATQLNTNYCFLTKKVFD